MAEEHLDRLKAALAERYVIREQIGQGGMATVYLAEDFRRPLSRPRPSACIFSFYMTDQLERLADRRAMHL